MKRECIRYINISSRFLLSIQLVIITEVLIYKVFYGTKQGPTLISTSVRR